MQYYVKFQVVTLQLGVIVDFTSHHLSFLYGIFGDTYLTIFQYNTQLPWEPQLQHDSNQNHDSATMALLFILLYFKHKLGPRLFWHVY